MRQAHTQTPSRCPFVGLADDPATSFGYPVEANVCHRASPPQPVSTQHQETACLSVDFEVCPIYQTKGAWRGALPKGILGHSTKVARNRKRWAIVGGIIASGVIVFAVLLLLGRRTAIPTTPSAVDIQLTLDLAMTETAQMQPTATATMTSSPTLTSSPTASPTATPTPLPSVPASIRARANLRSGPGVDYPVVDVLLDFDLISVIWRNETGTWLYVRTESEQEGWISASLVIVTFNIDDIPVAPDYLLQP